MSHNEAVIIIGGGLAGLTIAYRLKQRSIPFKLFEARTRLGGRVHTHYYSDGTHAELGGERFDGKGHEKIVTLCDELGVDLLQEGLLQMPLVMNDEWWGHRNIAHWLQNLEARFEYWVRHNDRKGLTIGQWIDRLSLKDYEKRGLKYFYKEFEEEMLTDPVEERTLDYLRDYFRLANYFEQSAQLARLPDDNKRQTQFKELASSMRIDFDPFHKYRIKGGNGLLIKRLAEEVGSHSIFTDHELVRLEENNGNFTSYFNSGGECVSIESQRVILTTPLSVLRESVDLSDLVLTSTFQEKVAQAQYLDYSKWILPLENKPWINEGYSVIEGTDADLGLMFWDSSHGQDKGLLTIFFQGSHEGEPTLSWPLDEDYLIKRFERFGMKRDHTRAVLSKQWKDQKYSLGAYMVTRSKWEENEKTELMDYARPQYQGKLLFAGEHCWEVPNYMNSAVASAEYLVQHFLADLSD